MKLELYLDKNLEQNAGIYFDKAKKIKKKIIGARDALESHKKKLQALLKVKEEEEKEYAAKKVEKKWFEKFRWFYTSDGFLVIGGRDASSNEQIIKKYTEQHDLVFHTDLAGSPFFILKTEGKAAGEASIKEVADATVSFSRVFKSGQSNSPVFWVSPEQVTKNPNTGEYLTKGAFVIRGKTNYVDNKINLAIGKTEEGKLMAAPLQAIKAHCKEYAIIVQGKSKPSDIAKKIRSLLGGSLDEIIRLLPSGEMDIRKA